MPNNIQLPLFQRIKIISPFWVLIIGYFIILGWIEPIPSPDWIGWIDPFIPFVWWMIVPYYFHYIGLILPPLLLNDKRKLKRLSETSIIITLVCYVGFILWPINATAVWNNVEPNHLEFLYSILMKHGWDQNSFPSMHVAISGFFMWVFAFEFPRMKWGFYMIGFSIFLSTFLIKQHFIIDSIAGIILAYAGFKYWIIKGKFGHDGKNNN